MMMLFLRDVPDQARAGEIKRVSRGYARNYLLPKGLAEIATDETLKRLDKVKAEGDAERARETHVVEELAEALDNVTVTIPGRITPTGRYYGAISGVRIADALGNCWNASLTVASPTRWNPSESRVSMKSCSTCPARSGPR